MYRQQRIRWDRDNQFKITSSIAWSVNSQMIETSIAERKEAITPSTFPYPEWRTNPRPGSNRLPSSTAHRSWRTPAYHIIYMGIYGCSSYPGSYWYFEMEPSYMIIRLVNLHATLPGQGMNLLCSYFCYDTTGTLIAASLFVLLLPPVSGLDTSYELIPRDTSRDIRMHQFYHLWICELHT